MRLRILAPRVLVAAAATSLWSSNAAAEGKIDCKMHFSLEGWAALYKHAEGHGVISCDNGRTVNVNIVAIGGGLTAGKYKVENGTGKFSDVSSIDQLFGDYAQGEANAGVVKSRYRADPDQGHLNPRTLPAAGEGVDIGISFGKFTITPVR